MVLLGMECLFTHDFLHTIMAYQHIDLLVLPGNPLQGTVMRTARPQLIITHGGIVEMALAYGISVLFLADWHDLPAYLPPQPRILVCCYPKRVPRWLLPLQIYNIHPSPLPALRGPDPLFYTARGDAPPAVTLHLMDAEFDTGAICHQLPVDTHACRSEREFIAAHAYVAAQMCGDHDIWHLPCTPQASLGASYVSWPHADDFVVQASWACVRTRNFLRWTDQRGHPYWVPALHDWVHSYADAVARGVPCSDGILT